MIASSRGNGDLGFLTWSSPSPDAASPVVLGAAYRELAEAVVAANAVVLQERVFGALAAAPASLAARRAALGVVPAFAVPPTWIEGAPCGAAGVAGVHLVVARGKRSAPRPLSWQGQPCGWLVEGDEATYLGLSDVGRLLVDEGCRTPVGEAAAVLELAADMMAASGFTFADVLRTWFYLDRILDWYDGFNRVRNDAYRRFGVLNGTSAPRIPASTGIRGRGLRGGWCTLDLVAARPRAGHQHRVERLVNPCQNEAPDYGSAFSRGLAVASASCRYLLVSGTAAIDAAGASCHPGDFTAQVECTLDTVAALLAGAGASLGDVCQATAFVKRPADGASLAAVLRRRGLESVPMVTVAGDVCRDELLFELDATAVQPAREPAGGC